ncbi:hypothetical protein HYT92_01995, partial [Candidatus Pacearchaeota archaeon]|nr:hypothetical protein [Candidatus Pacearchaeota archaeon]
AGGFNEKPITTFKLVLIKGAHTSKFLKHILGLLDSHGKKTLLSQLDSRIDAKKVELKIKDVVSVEIEIKNALSGTEKIISELGSYDLKDKIVLLKAYGRLEQGKASDIKFSEVDDFVRKKGAYAFLKSASKLATEESAKIDMDSMRNMENIEENIIKKYSDENPSKFNSLIVQLVNALDLEKQEDEKNSPFEERLVRDIIKILNV